MYRELVGVLPLVVQLLVDPEDSSVLVNGEIASLVTRYDGVADFAILTLFIWMVRHGQFGQFSTRDLGLQQTLGGPPDGVLSGVRQ